MMLAAMVAKCLRAAAGQSRPASRWAGDVRRALPTYDRRASRITPASRRCRCCRQSVARGGGGAVHPADPLGSARRSLRLRRGRARGHCAGPQASQEVWLVTIARHPMAYAAHRLAHWNATMRWLVPGAIHWLSRNRILNPICSGSARRRRGSRRSRSSRGCLPRVRLGAPILWLSAALAVLALGWRRDDGRSRLAVTLALSAVLTELAFLVISVAADYRYHLLGDARDRPRRRADGGCATAATRHANRARRLAAGGRDERGGTDRAATCR